MWNTRRTKSPTCCAASRPYGRHTRGSYSNVVFAFHLFSFCIVAVTKLRGDPKRRGAFVSRGAVDPGGWRFFVISLRVRTKSWKFGKCLSYCWHKLIFRINTSTWSVLCVYASSRVMDSCSVALYIQVTGCCAARSSFIKLKSRLLLHANQGASGATCRLWNPAKRVVIQQLRG